MKNSNFGCSILLTVLGLLLNFGILVDSNEAPIIINTWAFDQANLAGWQVLAENGSFLDAIVAACTRCETLQCDHTVGWGGSPDETGETTLDAMIMDGPRHKVGSVAALRRVKNVIAVARAVLDHTEHTMLAGDQATQFAMDMGFVSENLTSEWSANQYQLWRKNHCQPNYWRNVRPDSRENCGPYRPSLTKTVTERDRYRLVDETNHDTIGVVAIDRLGRMGCGTSTNGMKHKIPGRVGDSPIPGAGSYVDQDIGGAAATGDGDIIARFLSSYQAVESLRQGLMPSEAARESLRRISGKYPHAQVGIVVLDRYGNHGAACLNIDGGFPYVVRSADQNETIRVRCDISNSAYGSSGPIGHLWCLIMAILFLIFHSFLF